MQKSLFIAIISLLVYACAVSDTKTSEPTKLLRQDIRLYSEAVKDSFYISVQLPEGYHENPDKKYPTAYVTDANFYFPMLAGIVSQYQTAGLLPPMILVGIGYKSFPLMDSLRVRDYLYPAAIPSDEMQTPGGGKNFNDFIVSQLIPHIDANFHADTTSRSLLGHSFGGYFSLYALLNQIESKRSTFKSIASASPSLWYNNFYLNQLTEKLQNRSTKDSLNLFLTVGGSEEQTWNVAPVQKLAASIRKAPVENLAFQEHIYNDLEHMDVALISFTKALQAFYKMQENQ